MSKVFIITDEEIAAYVLAHQQKLLDSMQKASSEHPEASIDELLAYARQELVIQTTAQSWDYNAINQSISPEEENVELPVQDIEPELDSEDDQFVIEEHTPYSSEPTFSIDDPADENAEVETSEDETARVDDDPYDEEEDASLEEDEDQSSLAFRRKKYKGLFFEASKLDET